MTLKEKFLFLSNQLFLILIFLIPLNLGKHFEYIGSYVWGILIDYLIPTIYVQDIIAILILLFWILGGGLKKIIENTETLISKKEIQFSILFIFSLFLSVIASTRFIPSVYYWFRIFLYFSIFIYILIEIPVEDYFFKILNILALSVLLISILGIAQYFNKGSVFNNYLILGEQPYSASTFGITRKNLFGRAVVPAYGLFRHPNTFGGFLSLILIWLLSFIKKNKFYFLSFLFGLLALIFTFSTISWVVFILGIIFHLIFSKYPKNIKYRKRQAMYITVFICILMLILPLFKIFANSDDPSIHRRSNFLRASYRMINDYPLFGVGVNNSTIKIDTYNIESRDVRFTQPVHNMFVLIFSEAGVFSFLIFILFMHSSGKRLLNSSYFHLFLISFLQIILLGSFDHYFITMHQTLLLFWIVFGLALQ